MINHGDEKGLGHFSDPAETSADVLKDAESFTPKAPGWKGWTLAHIS